MHRFTYVKLRSGLLEQTIRGRRSGMPKHLLREGQRVMYWTRRVYQSRSVWEMWWAGVCIKACLRRIKGKVSRMAVMAPR